MATDTQQATPQPEIQITIPQSPAQNFCPKCGGKLKGAENFCPFCAAKLNE